MPSNISGVGMVCAREAGLLIPLRASTFNFAQEVETQDAQGYPQGDLGVLNTFDTVETSSTWTVNLGVQSLDKMAIEMLVYNQKSSTIATINAPQVIAATVPASSPYTVARADLVVDQVVDVTVLEDASPGNFALTQVASTATLAANQFKVDAGVITFHSGLAGKSIIYYYTKTLTAQDMIGASSNINKYENFEVLGKYKTTRLASRNIWFPRCSFDDGANFDVGADEFARALKAAIPSDLGWNFPYADWAA